MTWMPFRFATISIFCINALYTHFWSFCLSLGSPSPLLPFIFCSFFWCKCMMRLSAIVSWLDDRLYKIEQPSGWPGRFCPFLAVLRRVRVASGIKYLLGRWSPLWAAFLRLPKGRLKKGGEQDFNTSKCNHHEADSDNAISRASRFCPLSAVLRCPRVASGTGIYSAGDRLSERRFWGLQRGVRHRVPYQNR